MPDSLNGFFIHSIQSSSVSCVTGKNSFSLCGFVLHLVDYFLCYKDLLSFIRSHLSIFGLNSGQMDSYSESPPLYLYLLLPCVEGRRIYGENAPMISQQYGCQNKIGLMTIPANMLMQMREILHGPTHR